MHEIKRVPSPSAAPTPPPKGEGDTLSLWESWHGEAVTERVFFLDEMTLSHRER